MPEIIIIAAHDKNRVIGNNGSMPWHIPADLKRFKQLTLNNPIIMGRKTFNSIDFLPNRHNIVVSRSLPNYLPETKNKFFIVSSLEAAIELGSYSEKIYIIGGAEIYSQSLSIADTLELTILEDSYKGDTYFPEYAHLINTEFFLDREVISGDKQYTYKTYKRNK